MTDQHDANTSFFSWVKFWATPMGMFVIVVTIAIGMGTFLFIEHRHQTMRFEQEIKERRLAFCQNENEESRKTRAMWEGIIIQSYSGRPQPTIIIMEGRRINAQLIRQEDPEAVASFRKLMDDIYPIEDCKKF